MRLVVKLLGSQTAAAFVLFVFASGSSCFGADPTYWGHPVAGMRVGVSLRDTPSGKELRVAFENLGPTPQALLVGTSGGFSGVIDPSHAFSITAIGPDGTVHAVSHRISSAGQLIHAGLMQQHVETVPHGGVYEFRHPLADLAEYNRGGDIPVDNLLRQGYRIRIDYSVPRDRVRKLLYKYPDLWTGDIQSGEVALTRN